MWKSSSSAVTARLRCIHARRHWQNQKKKLSTESSGSQKPSPPPAEAQKPLAPPPARGPRFGRWVLGLTLIGSGGVVGYAWYDPNFRKQVEQKVPYSDHIFGTVLQYVPETIKINLPETLKPLENYFPWKWNQSETLKDVSENVVSKKQMDSALLQQKNELVNKEAHGKASKDTVAEKKAREKEEAEQQHLKEKDQEAAENKALELILNRLITATDTAIQETNRVQKNAVQTINEHSETLKIAMSDSKDILEKDNQWQAVLAAFQTRESAVNDYKEKLHNARLQIEKLQMTIKDGQGCSATKSNKVLVKAQEKLNSFHHIVGAGEKEVSKAEANSKVAIMYRELVHKGREQFRKELKSITPDIKTSSKDSKMTEDELNSLIAHAHCRIEQFQNKMAEMESSQQLLIENVLDKQKEEDEILAMKEIEQERENLLNQFKLEKQKMAADAQVQFEEELRHHLSRQAAAHSDHIRDVLKVQQDELDKQFQKELSLRLLEERAKFQTEVSGWIGRIKGIEAAVEARAEVEKIAKESQELWQSSVALRTAIQLGRLDRLSTESSYKALDKEMDEVCIAGQNHPFVNIILQTIPEVARSRGVYTEESLKERFAKVKHISKRVALVENTGGSLFQYFVSALQSLFIFDVAYLKKEPDLVDLSKMNTFIILAKAEYFIEKGEFEKAFRLMNQLDGISRFVASDWLEETRCLLEARQAAEALMAFSLARGLGKLF